MVTFRRVLAATMIAAVAVVSVGCGNDYLRDEELYEDDPGFRIAEEANIPDRTEYREILDVLAHYKHAVVSKDFGTLRRLTSEDYYENAGTIDTTEDDYSADSLSAIFELMAERAEEIKFSVVVQEVDLDAERDRATIDYEYEFAYKYDVGEDSAWDAGADVNQLELMRENDQWRIIGGM